MATKTTQKVKASDFDDLPARDAKLFLIDGSSLAYRSFFALPQEIGTSDGRPTNALLGFSNMMFKLLTDYDPKTVIVAWDVGGETVRKRTFAEYKSHRPEMPDLLSQQWPHFKPLAEAFGFSNISHAEYEADDVIGTLARQATERGIKTCIVTSDRDSLQLVNDKVVVMMNTKGMSEVAVYTPERVQLRYGVAPSQIADLISLRGDTSDNIPGVPGIGEKTAADLLSQFSTLEKILDSIDKVSGAKRKENLRTNTDQAILSKELATIVCDLPLDINLDEVHAAAPDRSRLGELFRTLEFRTLVRRVIEMEADDWGGGSNDDGSTASESSAPVSPAELLAARIVSPHELKSVLAAQPQSKPISIVVRAEDEVVTAACLIEEGVPDGGEAARWVAVLQTNAATLVESLNGQKVQAFDFKSMPDDLTRSASAVKTANAIELTDDLLLLTYLLQPGRRTFLLGEILGELGLSVRLTFGSDDVQLREVATQAALLGKAIEIQRAELEALGMTDLYRNIELPLVQVLIEVEQSGVQIDAYRMGEISRKVADQIDEMRDRALELAGEDFNLGSPSQLAGILFEKLGLPAQRKGKTGFSTDARVLRDLRDMHPIVPVIEQYRELSKLKNTYLDTLPDLVDKKTGRIHTTFSQTTAATGRLSSINPNLQNIPVRTAIGREIRSTFVPADGCRFVSCDYSQVELRLLAHVSQEPKLIEVFERGEDVHLATAAEVAGVDPSEVSRDQRNAAKAINFGIIYGISSFGLSNQLQISREDAQQYIDRYLGRYPHVSDFIERTVEVAKEQGFVTTLFGRRRPIPEFKSRSYTTRQLGERLAVNTILQGTAADIMKIAMIHVHNRLKAMPTSARIVLQIHDELLLEVPEDEAVDIAKLVRDEMVNAFQMKPPLEVDSGSGVNWLDAK